MVTKDDVINLLKDLKIKSNDKIAVHCSLKSIGEIDGGADGLIDAFCEYLSDGLLIIPTHTWNYVIPKSPVYDVKKTVPCIGVLPTVAAFREDAVRSLHPTHSVAVFGKGAEDYIRGEEKSVTPAPKDGWMRHFYEDGGKVLLLGVGQSKNTYIHYAEEKIDVPDRINNNSFDVTIIDKDGNEYMVQSYSGHHTEALGYESCSIYYPNYEKVFDYHGALKYSTLGNAKATLCDARRIAKIIEVLWERADHDLCISNDEIPEEYYKDIEIGDV